MRVYLAHLQQGTDNYNNLTSRGLLPHNIHQQNYMSSHKQEADGHKSSHHSKIFCKGRGKVRLTENESTYNHSLYLSQHYQSYELRMHHQHLHHTDNSRKE